MKISELKTATCAVELPRLYTRKEAIALAESWGLKMSALERNEYLGTKNVKYFRIRSGEYSFYVGDVVRFKNAIKLSDIEP